MFEKIIHHSQ